MIKSVSTYFIIFLSFYSCLSQNDAVSLVEKNVPKSSNFLGWLDEYQINKVKGNDWYKNIHSNYDLDTVCLSKSKFKENINNLEIVLFIGLWCPDSKRFLPKFLKMTEYLNVNSSKIKIYATDRTKTQSPEIIKTYDILFVPTAIIFKDNVEINRIIEYTNKSIENDFYNIVMNNNYVPFH